MLFYQYTGFFAIPQAPEWLPRAENARFLALAGPAIRWLRMRRTIRRDKEHRYFKCPNCGQYLRVPRGKGKITVNCRNCGASFEERS